MAVIRPPYIPKIGVFLINDTFVKLLEGLNSASAWFDKGLPQASAHKSNPFLYINAFETTRTTCQKGSFWMIWKILNPLQWAS